VSRKDSAPSPVCLEPGHGSSWCSVLSKRQVPREGAAQNKQLRRGDERHHISPENEKLPLWSPQMRRGLISNKWELRELRRASVGKRCNHRMITNDTLGRCWVNDNHQTQSWRARQRRCILTQAPKWFLSCGGWMTALITHKPRFAYPRVNWCQFRGSEGEANPSEEKDEEDEEMDHILPGVRHANDFLGKRDKKRHHFPGTHYHT